MNIDPVTDERDIPGPTWWQPAGEVCLNTALFFATVASIPAPFRKKRTYISIQAVQTGNEGPLGVAVATPDTLPPPKAEEQQKIVEIFTTVADRGWKLFNPSTAFKLKGYGNDIIHLHPFATIPVIPKEHMKSILQENNFFKINGVVNGISESLRKEKARGNLERYIPQLARQMNKSQKQIKEYVTYNQWNGLLHYLFEASQG